MTELYEFAKQFDVIVIFILLYGFAIGSIVYWITDFLHWCWTKFKKHREKKAPGGKTAGGISNAHRAAGTALLPPVFMEVTALWQSTPYPSTWRPFPMSI